MSSFTWSSIVPPPAYGSPGDLEARADILIAQAANAVSTMVNTANGVASVTVTPTFPASVSAPAILNPAAPSVTAPIWVAPGVPAAFTSTLDVGDLAVAPFDDNPPTINYGTAPAEFSAALPTAPAVNLNFADPVLSLTLPVAPDLLSISVTPFSGVNLPTFSDTAPVLTAIAPSIREYTPGTMYTSGLLTAAQASLLARITTGGTGLAAGVEAAIWDRGREREAKSYRDGVKSLEQMEALGYVMPPGAYLAGRIQLATERDYQDRGHSREVMIKAAELELDNVKHALTTATQLEGELMTLSNQYEQRLFDSCKYATEAGIAIYNAQVQTFISYTELYKTKVNVYEALIRGEIAKVEVYKAQIDAEQAKAQVNTALVEQYKVKAQVASYSIDIFKAQVAAIQTKAEIEKTKVEIFGEQIRGYSAQVAAYTAGVEAFRAKLEAEGTKQKVYQSQVEAFSARVDASAKQIGARVAGFKALVDAKTGEYDGYKAQVAAETARVQGLVSSSGLVVDTYKATVQGVSSYNEVLTKQWQAVLDQNQRTSEIANSVAKANAELAITTRNIVSDSAKVSAQVFGQLGAAAIGAVNFSSSVSNSTAESYNGSDSFSVSTSYNHNIID